MSQSILTAPGTMVLILISLSGCATFEKCGVKGCASDNEITANVHSAFAQHPELGEPNSINVQTVNNVVYLTGGVSAGEMRATAESVARQVKGVGRVEDTIYVTK
jgi:osmotically-inducible protein OsmY